MVFVLTASSFAGVALGGVEKAYRHFTGIDRLEAFILASNQEHNIARELMQIQYDRRDINGRVLDLKKQRTEIYRGGPLSPQDNAELREIDSYLQELRQDKNRLNNRERMLKK